MNGRIPGYNETEGNSCDFCNKGPTSDEELKPISREETVSNNRTK
jgi:hypothetical protein